VFISGTSISRSALLQSRGVPDKGTVALTLAFAYRAESIKSAASLPATESFGTGGANANGGYGLKGQNHPNRQHNSNI